MCDNSRFLEKQQPCFKFLECINCGCSGIQILNILPYRDGCQIEVFFKVLMQLKMGSLLMTWIFLNLMIGQHEKMKSSVKNMYRQALKVQPHVHAVGGNNIQVGDCLTRWSMVGIAYNSHEGLSWTLKTDGWGSGEEQEAEVPSSFMADGSVTTDEWQ